MGTVIELSQTLKVKQSPNPKGSKGEHRRPRKWLSPAEVRAMVVAIRKKKIGRSADRDALMIDLAYRHGLRASELLELRWAQFDMTSRNPFVHVVRKKEGTPGDHPIEGDVLRALREHERRYKDSPYVFYNEQTGGPFTVQMFHKLVVRAGAAAGLPFPAHPHMLRHARGTMLAKAGRTTRDSRLSLVRRTSRTRRSILNSRPTPSASAGLPGAEGRQPKGSPRIFQRHWDSVRCCALAPRQ